MTVRETIGAILTGDAEYEAGLDQLTVAPAADVDAALTAALLERCAQLFGAGWQPAELHRVVARRGTPQHLPVIADAVHAHLRRFPDDAVDPRWRAQADELPGEQWSDTYPQHLAQRLRLDRVAVLDLLLGLLGELARLPRIETLVPPPGTTVPVATVRTGGRLDRVRALLAKAESTSFPAEAEAYAAKAQEIITRYSLDAALLTRNTAEPLARRIGVDHPYEAEKAALLDAVAQANRCHSVWSPELGFSTVFGFDVDIDAVDVMHASLLVQAHRAMSAAEPPGGKANRKRLKTFRQSFLVAFAARVGERLADTAEAVVATAESDLLPVLASRDAQVRDEMHRIFPRTVAARGGRVDSVEGWDSGRAAADSAQLAG